MDPRKTHSVDYRYPAVHADLGDGWTVSYRLAPQGSEVIITEIRVQPRDELPPGGITARLLRNLRPGLALRMFRESYGAHIQHPELGNKALMFVAAGKADLQSSLAYIAEQERRWRPWADVVDRLRAAPSGRANRLLRLAQTAALHVAATDRGDDSPNETVARIQGRTPRIVRDDLYAARHGAGLLTPTRRGRPGGQLTEMAIALLEEEAT